MILLSKKSEMKFHWMMTIMIYGLKIIGLAPFSHQIKTPAKNSGKTLIVRCFRLSKIGMAYNVLISIFLNITAPMALEGIIMAFSHYGSIKTYVNILQFVVLYTTINVVMVFCTVRQNHAVSFMNRLLEVDRLLSGIETDLIANRMIFVLFISHAIFNTTMWISWIYVSHTDLFNFSTYAVWWWVNLTRFIIFWFIVEYSVVLGLLAREFRRVNMNLLKLEENRNNLSADPPINERVLGPNYSRRNHLDRLDILLTVRTVLYEVSRDVAEYFSFPILVTISCQFCLFIKNCYILTMVLRSNDNLILLIKRLYLIAISVYPISMLSLNVSKAVKEAKLTRWIIQKLLNAARRQDAKEELEDYSLQLLHEDLSYTAYGIFTLDSTMLISIIEATASYLVIMVQADLAENNRD